MNPAALETDPKLLVLQAAIRAAADRDDVAGMASACLEHAAESLQIAKNKPAEVLKQRKEVAEIIDTAEDSSLSSKNESLFQVAKVLAERHDFTEIEHHFAIVGNDQDFSRDKAFMLVVERLTSAFQIKEARRFASQINNPFLKVEALIHISETLLEMQQYEVATKAFKEAWIAGIQIEEVVDRFASVTPIVFRDRLDNVRQMFYDEVHRVKDRFQRDPLLEGLLLHQVEAEQFDMARQTIKQMLFQKSRDYGFCDIVRRQIYVGDFEQAEVTATNIHSLQRRDDNLFACKMGRGKQSVLCGSVEEGRGTFADVLIKVRRIKNEDRRFRLLRDLAGEQVAAGLFRDAIETASLIDSQYSQTQILLNISKAQAKKSQYADAKQTVSMILPLNDKVQSLSHIAVEEIHVGQLVEGRSTFASAVEVAQKIEYKPSHFWSLWSIALQQMEINQIGDALSTADVAWNVALLVEGMWERSQFVFQVAHLYVKAGRLADAVRIGMSIPQGRYMYFEQLAHYIAASEETDSNPRTEDKLLYFKQLLIPCAYYRRSAYGICSLLAEIYPEQAGAIGRVIASSSL